MTITTIHKRLDRINRLAEYARQDKNIAKCRQAYTLIQRLNEKATELYSTKLPYIT